METAYASRLMVLCISIQRLLYLGISLLFLSYPSPCQESHIPSSPSLVGKCGEKQWKGDAVLKMKLPIIRIMNRHILSDIPPSDLFHCLFEDWNFILCLEKVSQSNFQSSIKLFLYISCLFA